MCRRSVNVSVRLYDNVIFNDGKLILENQFDQINAKKDEYGKPYIEDFSIVTMFDLLGTTKQEEQATNIVNGKQSIDVLIRMTKISKNTEKQFTWDVSKFTINPDIESIHEACVPFINITRAVNINKLYLNEDYVGKYAVKVLMKNPNEELWTLQSVSQLIISNEE